MRKIIVLGLVLGVTVFSFSQFYLFLRKHIVTSNFKLVTESRIGQLIGADVHVDRISVGLLNHVSISGLKIEGTSNRIPLLLGAKKLEVRYDVRNFMKRDFRIPKAVFLDMPKLSLNAFRPEVFFKDGSLKSERGFVTNFELQDGELELPWFNPDEKFLLSAIQASVKPGDDQVFRAELSGELKGVATGKVSATGRLDTAHRTLTFSTSLLNVDFLPTSGLPVTDLEGSLELTGDTVQLKDLSFKLRGIPCEADGEVRQLFSKKPAVRVNVRLKDQKMPGELKLSADLEQSTLSGELRVLSWIHRFNGTLIATERNVFTSDFMLNNEYESRAVINLRDMAIELSIERLPQRFLFQFSMGKFSGRLDFTLNHLKIYEFDLVTAAQLQFAPDENLWKSGVYAFDTELSTDYLVFQYQPLRNFRLNAKISARGIDGILAKWGNVSELEGRVDLTPEPAAKLVIRTGALTLDEFRSFGTHPLPRSLKGVLEGKMEASGALMRPLLKGAFQVTDGKVGKLQYEHAEINFTGYLPYLKLENSKVTIGKNDFLLEGAVDFKMRNFLQGVEVVNSEHVLIWKGLELTREIEKIQAEDMFARGGANNMSRSEAIPARVNADYKISKRTSLQVTAEEDRNKREYVTAGPKLTF